MKYSVYLVIATALLSFNSVISATLDEAPLPKAKVGLPNLGQSSHDAFSSQDEKILGNILWREIRQDTNYINDPYIIAYLHRLTNRLNQGLDPDEKIDLKTFAIHDPQLNAFAMPGKLLGVHSGLILNINREGELAAVIAHEIGHLSQKHFARRMADQSNQKWIQFAGLAAAVLAAKSNSSSKGSLFEGAMVSTQALMVNKTLSFSREMEYEADNVGLQLMQAAQFDGIDMVRMLKRLHSGQVMSEPTTAYARTHPSSIERFSSIESRLRAISPPNTRPKEDLDFLLFQARVRAMTALTGDEQTTAEQHFEKQLLLTDATIRETAKYGLALLFKAQNKPQQSLSLLSSIQISHPWVGALRQQLGAPSGEFEQSVNQNLRNYPELAITVTNLAIQKKQFLKQHIAMLESLLQEQPYQDMAWTTIAKWHESQKQYAYANYALAESLAAQNMWQSSLPLLDQAITAIAKEQQLNVQTQWVSRELSIKQSLKDEQLFEQKNK